MMNKTLGTLSVLGFARYKKREAVNASDLIEAVLDWRRGFLDHQAGIAAHCFLGNLQGHFADLILAVDQTSYDAMVQAHPQAAASQAMAALLKPESIRLTPSRILKDFPALPEDFACVEFGSFRPVAGEAFDEDRLLEVSAQIEADYLSRRPESRAHFLARIDPATYAEVAFVQNLGAAREICFGYQDNNTCRQLLEMFDPRSVDLDFWFVLA
ncbi:hypothetical protein [Pelagibius sp.]|uniref:hypothetical protein n=1 Tax=Pelagibius sp. TaxID=1931238 RepID=UPI003B508BAC